MPRVGNAGSREPRAKNGSHKSKISKRPRKSWDTQRQPKTGDSNDTKNGWTITGVKLQESGRWRKGKKWAQKAAKIIGNQSHPQDKDLESKKEARKCERREWREMGMTQGQRRKWREIRASKMTGVRRRMSGNTSIENDRSQVILKWQESNHGGNHNSQESSYKRHKKRELVTKHWVLRGNLSKDFWWKFSDVELSCYDRYWRETGSQGTQQELRESWGGGRTVIKRLANTDLDWFNLDLS